MAANDDKDGNDGNDDNDDAAPNRCPGFDYQGFRVGSVLDMLHMF